MKRLVAVVFALALGACASSAPHTLNGRYALSLPGSDVPDWASVVADDLRARGAHVDYLHHDDNASAYDAVIVLDENRGKPTTAFDGDRRPTQMVNAAPPDASGNPVSNYIGKLTYEIRRGDVRIGAGSANLSFSNVYNQPNEQRAFNAQAAHSLASEIAKKLARG